MRAGFDQLYQCLLVAALESFEVSTRNGVGAKRAVICLQLGQSGR